MECPKCGKEIAIIPNRPVKLVGETVLFYFDGTVVYYVCLECGNLFSSVPSC